MLIIDAFLEDALLLNAEQCWIPRMWCRSRRHCGLVAVAALPLFLPERRLLDRQELDRNDSRPAGGPQRLRRRIVNSGRRNLQFAAAVVAKPQLWVHHWPRANRYRARHSTLTRYWRPTAPYGPHCATRSPHRNALRALRNVAAPTQTRPSAAGWSCSVTCVAARISGDVVSADLS